MSNENLQELMRELEYLWQDQRPPDHPVQDLTPAFPLASQPAPAEEGAASPGQVADALRAALGWPQWVQLYPKPSLAVMAINRLARQRGLPGGISWVAPGTGAPLDSSPGNLGTVVLRGDWAPSAGSMKEAERNAKERGLMLVLDESMTGFRAPGGGVRDAMGLDPDVVLYGPNLTRERRIAVLAGKGQPAPAGKPPQARDLAQLAANIPLITDPGLPGRLEEGGWKLVTGLRHFIKLTGQFEEVRVEGPDYMPRLDGRRVWAFIELANEEGLALSPVVMLNDSLDGDGAKAALTRVARALARLRVLPEGEKAPLGWKDAAQPTSCARVDQMLASIEES